ncbi:hypothetical protein PIB30_099852, partial [Stylosanthes scabra]|nr:hypothetical protein [Stylosanthes scabra]
RVVTLCLGYGLKCADDLSCRSLRATDKRNGVNSDAVNATPLSTAGGPSRYRLNSVMRIYSSLLKKDENRVLSREPRLGPDTPRPGA